jgi:hypothetical protein
MSKWNLATKWISRELAVAGGTIFGLINVGKDALAAGDSETAKWAFIAAGITALGYAGGMGVQKAAAALDLPGGSAHRVLSALIDGLKLAEERPALDEAGEE